MRNKFCLCFLKSTTYLVSHFLHFQKMLTNRVLLTNRGWQIEECTVFVLSLLIFINSAQSKDYLAFLWNYIILDIRIIVTFPIWPLIVKQAFNVRKSAKISLFFGQNRSVALESHNGEIVTGQESRMVQFFYLQYFIGWSKWYWRRKFIFHPNEQLIISCLPFNWPYLR